VYVFMNQERRDLNDEIKLKRCEGNIREYLGLQMNSSRFISQEAVGSSVLRIMR
jgi:hypothetical protein